MVVGQLSKVSFFPTPLMLGPSARCNLPPAAKAAVVARHSLVSQQTGQTLVQ